MEAPVWWNQVNNFSMLVQWAKSPKKAVYRSVIL